jgi:hypothetical protein
MERIGAAVHKEVQRFGHHGAIGDVVKVWAAAVGEQIARNAWPARVGRDGVLFVHTSSSAWAFELSQLESDIRARLGGAAPAKIRFAPGPLPEHDPSSSDQSVPTPVEPSAEEVDAGARIAAPIDDEMLRKLVARAAAASLAKARSDHRF